MKEKLCDATGANQYMDLASQLLGSNKKDAEEKKTEIEKNEGFHILFCPLEKKKLELLKLTYKTGACQFEKENSSCLLSRLSVLSDSWPRDVM